MNDQWQRSLQKGHLEFLINYFPPGAFLHCLLLQARASESMTNRLFPHTLRWHTGFVAFISLSDLPTRYVSCCSEAGSLFMVLWWPLDLNSTQKKNTSFCMATAKGHNLTFIPTWVMHLFLNQSLWPSLARPACRVRMRSGQFSPWGQTVEGELVLQIKT